MHTPNNPDPRKINPTQKTTNTAHCRRSVKQTAQRAENFVEQTVPDKNRSGSLNAMRSTRKETKNTREGERLTRDKTETWRMEVERAANNNILHHIIHTKSKSGSVADKNEKQKFGGATFLKNKRNTENWKVKERKEGRGQNGTKPNDEKN